MEMHHAAPGDDWRALERANANTEQGRRADATDVPSLGVWEEVGSSNQAGHTRCAALGPADPAGRRHLYVGSANGGLWRGNLGGKGWEPVSDQLFGGVDEVLALPALTSGGPDRLLLRRGSDLAFSVDGGVRWETPSGLEAVSRVHRMLVLPAPVPEVLLLAQNGQGHARLLVSRDGGRGFEPRWRGPRAEDMDLWVARTGESAGREVWLALGGELRRSLDGGASFGPRSELGKEIDAVHLAGSEAGGPRIYCAARSRGTWKLYRGMAAGRFRSVATLEGFWGSLIAFSGDPKVVLFGGLEGYRSVNGGETFERINAWGHYYGDPAEHLHADVRGMASLPDPGRPGRDLCLISTDGGTYLSHDRGRTVRNLCLTGLGVGQVYSTLTASNDPGLILSGTQDQGYQRGRLRKPIDRGPSTPFDQLLSGDYGYLTWAGGTHDLVYASYPGFVLVQEGASDPDLLYPWVDLPTGAEHAWMPPIAADPTDAEGFYLLADHLYRYQRKEGPYWNYRIHSPQDFTGGGGHYLTAIAFAARMPERMFAASDAGRIWTSEDGGVSWAMSRVRGNEHLRPTSIAAHPKDPDRAVVGGAGYSGSAVLRTTDGGRSWSPIGDGLPRTLVYELAWADDGTGDLYAATEAGAWRLRGDGRRWENLLGLDAPATTYWCVEAVPRAGRMRFGTYGRGIWDFKPAAPRAR